VRRLAVTLIAVIIAMIAMTYYGVQVEALAVQIETSIEQALARVSIPMVAFVAFVVLAVTLLLRLLTGRTRSLMGVRS
jgi:glucan phosphoethanolaminetransferase (alkaline phosphatase superfamily)